MSQYDKKDALIAELVSALKHYTSVVSSVNDPNDFTPKMKDEGIYARNALSTAAKMGYGKE